MKEREGFFRSVKEIWFWKTTISSMLLQNPPVILHGAV
jgi:hypothetical protein